MSQFVADQEKEKLARLSSGCDAEKALEAKQDDSGTSTGSGQEGGGFIAPVSGSGMSCGTVSWNVTTVYPDGFTTVQHYSKWVCFPIALDLDRDGIEFRTQENPTHADFDGDGRYSDYSWISPDDGLIVYDDNGDGIGQKDEWVLTTFVHGAQTDLEALRAFDSDGNGILNANDATWAKLKVGRDFDQNGRFDAGELSTFDTHDIKRSSPASGCGRMPTAMLSSTPASCGASTRRVSSR